MHSLGAQAADFEAGRTALLEITKAETIGEPAGSIDEGDGVVSVHFETTLPGYPGWHWTVSIAHLDGGAPSVLETELTPGDGALLAPDWVPWSDRLAEYRAAQEAAEAAESAAAGDVDAEEGGDEDDADDDALDDADEDDLLQTDDDLDGVDIDDDPAPEDSAPEDSALLQVAVEQPEGSDPEA